MRQPRYHKLIFICRFYRSADRRDVMRRAFRWLLSSNFTKLNLIAHTRWIHLIIERKEASLMSLFSALVTMLEHVEISWMYTVHNVTVTSTSDILIWSDAWIFWRDVTYSVHPATLIDLNRYYLGSRHAMLVQFFPYPV